jgi:hypothetical protein
MGRELFISLGITILASVILFLYFRHRFKVVEHKVNTIFQLVQNHSRPPPMRPSPNLRPRGQYGPPPGIVLEEKRPEETQLIEVSEDDDSDSGSEDSMTSVSDDEGDPIVISQLGNSNLKDIKIEPASKILLQEPQEIHLDSNSEAGSLSDQSDLSSTAPSESSPVKSIEPTDYHKLNMVTLKQIAEDRGLQGFKKLRKPALVELLSK